MSLRTAAFSAGRWTTASSLCKFLFQTMQTMLLARILAPGDFGLMALAVATQAIVAVFADLGLGSALMHFAAPPKRVLSTLYWLNLITATALALILVGLATPLAATFGEPRLAGVMMTSSLALPLGALGAQVRTLASKDLRFAALARNEIASVLAGFATACTIAFAGGGVFALVGGLLVGTATSSVLALWLLQDRPWPAFAFDIGGARPFLRFGGYKIGETLASMLRMQADVFVGGLIAGSAALAFYAVPREWTSRVGDTIVNPIVTKVSLPLMSKSQSNPAALRSIYLHSLAMTASVNFPIYAGFVMWAEEIVWVLLGPRWTDAAFFLRLLAVWGAVRAVGNPVGTLLYAVGMVRRALCWNLVLLVVFPIAMYTGARVGNLEGLAWSVVVLQLLVFVPAWRILVQPACGATFADYARPLTAPLVASAVAAGAGLALSSFADAPVARLVLGGAAMASVYAGTSWLINRQWLLAMIELMSPRLRNRIGAGT